MIFDIFIFIFSKFHLILLFLRKKVLYLFIVKILLKVLIKCFFSFIFENVIYIC